DSWTADKSKEHNWYKRHLRVLTKDPELSSKARSALEAFQVDHSVIPHHNASDISATVDGPFSCSQVDHSVIPHHNASDISATVDGPNLRSMLATFAYWLLIVAITLQFITIFYVESFTNIHFSPNKDESISSAVKKFWQDVEDTERREKIDRKKASTNLLNGLEESTYDILDTTRANVVENVKAENKKHNVIQEDAENNPFLVSSKRAKLGSESPSNRRDSSSSASSHTKSDSELLSDENDSSSKHAKSDNKPPSDRRDSLSSSSSHAKSVSDGNDLLSKQVKSDSKPPSNRSDSSLKSDGSDSTWKPNESEDDDTEDEDDKKKKLESKLFWFVGPAEMETNISNIHKKWILDGTNISDLFFQFRELSITKALNEKIERSSEILPINHIFLMHDSENDGHIIDRKLWDSAIQQIYQEYPLPDLPDNWLSKCNEMAEMARNDFKNNKSLLRNWYQLTDKESDNIIFDVFYNVLNMYTLSGTMEDLNEDSFVHKVLSPIISPFFKDSFEFSSVWANETLDSSAYRKKKFDPSLEGREPDFAVYTSTNQEKENLLIVEVKSPKRVSSNKDKLNDLIKIGNGLKDCIDKMIDDGINDNVPVCGILVEGK
ncbi:10785_t:CDS:2, partial [Gigaspora margarita]